MIDVIFMLLKPDSEHSRPVDGGRVMLEDPISNFCILVQIEHEWGIKVAFIMHILLQVRFNPVQASQWRFNPALVP